MTDGLERNDADDQRTGRRVRYRELLEEVRTVVPGVQVLFAFLLIAPFSSRFPKLDGVGRFLYGIAVVAAAVSTVLLLAPTSYHRLERFSRKEPVDRRQRLRFANRTAISGLAFLMVATVATVLLVTRFVYGNAPGAALAFIVATVGILTWYVLPYVRHP
ncbi:MAG: DUF6328 family protein [Actinomycetota bacterium]|nr:DUF6328 family protein [Actinomycetota bacterium]